ncbi:MAG: amidohydrolase family protein [Acidimicrobiia bacterium]
MSALLIEARHVVHGSADGRAVADGGAGWVEIDGGLITAVGTGDASDERRAAAGERIDAGHGAVMPGFVNAHTHLFQTFFRGLRDDLEHSEWNSRVIGDNVGKLTEEDFYLAALLGSIENLMAGCTTVVDNHYVHTSSKNTDRVAEAMGESGVRGWLARGTIDRRDVLTRTTGRLAAEANTEPIDQSLGELERIAGNWHHTSHGRIRISAAVQAAWAASPQLLARLTTFAHDNGLLLHAHCAETQTSDRRSHDVHGCSEIEAFERSGFLGVGTQLVHGVWLGDAGMAIAAAHQCGVVHCPVSNAYLASGVAPIQALRSLGIPVALAADGSASNHRQDPFEAMKVATLLQRAVERDATIMCPEETLAMAWHGGAAVLGRAGHLGVLAPGAAADVIVVDLDKANIEPMHRLTSALVFCATPGDVRHVIVDGQIVVRDRVPTTVDLPALLTRCRDRIAQLNLSAAGPQR